MTKLTIFEKNRLALDGPVKKGQLASKSDLGGQGRKLVAIDSRLEDYEKLAGGVEFGTDVLILDPQRDAIAQIARALSDRPADSLQIVCHGAPGILYMGKTPLTGDNLSQYSYILSELAVKDILLYACNVAEDKNFIHKLNELTGANIAASANKIGNAAKGGTWELEERVGEVTTTGAFLPEVRRSYPGVLISFTASTENELTSRPFTVSIADFNTDGRPDLAVTLDNDNQVVILLGNEDGSYADPVPYDTGGAPAFIAVADLDGDGDLDLAIANFTSNDVSVLLGEGDGTFVAAGDNIAVGTAPYGIVAADFTGDDILDLVAGNYGVAEDGTNDTVSLLAGNGDGTFGEAVNFEVGDAPANVVTADFDGDGNPDIATANETSQDISVLLGDGDGGFADATSVAIAAGESDRLYVLATADLDGDSNPDLAVTNANVVSVLLGDGDGGFGDEARYDVGDRPSELTIADFDGDGNLDIATANLNSDNVSVLAGNGDGTFADATNIDSINAVWGVTAEDLDADGLPDLVVGSQEDGTVAVLVNVTDEEPEPVDTEPTSEADNLLGTSEGDRISGLEGDDTIRGAAGNDTLVGQLGNDRLVGNDGNDRLFGNGGSDVLLGREGNDLLLGGNGEDQLEGGIGRDRLNGGAGNDQLTGGASKDAFIFNTNSAFATEDIGLDTITDFQVDLDVIILDKTTFAALQSDSGSQPFNDEGIKGFSIDTEFEIVEGEDAVRASDAFIIYDSQNGGLYYNPDGDSVQFATLTDAPELTADNLFLR